MDDLFTQENDDSYREIHLSNGFHIKAGGNPNNNLKFNSIAHAAISNFNSTSSNKMILDKLKSREEVVEDQLDDFNDSAYSKNEYIQMALHYKSLCKVRLIHFRLWVQCTKT